MVSPLLHPEKQLQTIDSIHAGNVFSFAVVAKEGRKRKTFLLTFDDNSNVVMKLPNLNSGPAIFTIASKVMMIEFISHQYQLPSSSKHNYIRQVIEMEAQLVSVLFPAHGCIYRKQDLPSGYSQNQISFNENNLHEFCIGPVIDSVFWSDYRSELYNTDAENLSEYLALIKKYLLVAPFITPLPLGWHMPEKPENYHDLPQDAKLKADKLYQSALCHKYYEVVTAKKNPRYYVALLYNNNLHREELENREYVEQLMEQFQEAGILPIDGVADPEDYEILQRTNVIQKSRFLSLAESEEEKMWMDKIWPYQDRPQDT
ncbi:hypothetical protein BJX64DRAFT_282273 [Aspergillus heterothallicus]